MLKTKKIIIYKLTSDLLIIWRDALTQATLNRDHLAVRILLTLSQKLYVNELLFRDFNLDKEEIWYKDKIHQQSVIYLETVLMRRLTLANNLKESPTNMHILYEALCQFGTPEHAWKSAQIQRDNNRGPNCEDNLWFRSVAKQLSAQCQKLGNHFSDISQRRRAQYGPLWLLLADCRVEVPEELALLFDVLEALPIPLQSDFVNNPKLQGTLNRVLESLNERYMLLRSCGLNPEDWMDCQALSINNLKDMKQLRKTVTGKLATGEERHLEATAYQRAFKQLQGEQKKFAGCTHFEEFAASEWGRGMLNYLSVSLNSTCHEDADDEETLQDKLADPNEDSILEQLEARERKRMLVKTCPELFGNDPVLIYFFCEILSGYQNFPPADPAFKELVQNSPNYAPLSAQELFKVLCDKVDEIANQGFNRVKKRLHNQRLR